MGTDEMNDRQLPALTADELEQLIRKAVRKELSAVGLRIEDAEQQEETREDFRMLRRARKAYDGATAKIGGAVILAIVGGLIWLVSMGAQSFMSK